VALEESGQAPWAVWRREADGAEAAAES